MLGNLKNLAGLMGQMGEIKERAEKMQAELARLRVEGDAGAGAVRVVMNGKFEVLEVKLDRPLLATLAGGALGGVGDADAKVIEDLIAAAFNSAQERARNAMQEEMQKATGGLNIPGLEKMFQS